MSLAQLFYRKESLRRRVHQEFELKPSSPVSGFTMEQLEDRLLLSAAPVALDDYYTIPEDGGGVPMADVALVEDILPGASGSDPQNLVDVNGTLFFSAYMPTYGRELWKSDGTAAGTMLVKDIGPGAATTSYLTPQFLTNVNGTLLFIMDDGVHGLELWKSDGTEAGTLLVKDINPGSANGFYFGLSDKYAASGNFFYFTATDGVNGQQLWRSDGTDAGTVVVSAPGSINFDSLTDVNGTLYFSALMSGSGYELWKTDVGGTFLIDVVSGANSSSPNWLTNVNGTLFFAAANSLGQTELFKYTDAFGALQVANLNGTGSANPRYLTNVNGTLFFTATALNVGYELFKSDGTDLGTVFVADLNPGAGGSDETFLTAVGDKLFFRRFDGSALGFRLWVSDGTEAGTLSLGLNVPDTANGSPMITDVNGVAFFRSGGSPNLGKSDGTVAGTTEIMTRSFPRDLTEVDGTLFFTAVDVWQNVAVGRELWKVDGSVNVLANDHDPDGDTITALLVDAPQNGNVILNPDGTFTYTPNESFTGSDFFTYQASDGSLLSNLATVHLNVTAVNDAPQLANGNTLTYTPNQIATAISPLLTVTDVDSTTLAGATVSLSGNFVTGQDMLGFTNVAGTMGNIAGGFNATTGVLALTSSGATATLAQWQTALRTVTYVNTSGSPSPASRTVSYQVNDGGTVTNLSNVLTSTINVTAAQITLDVDGNGQADALTDGILVTRYLFGFTGDQLIDGAIDPQGVRGTAPAVEGYLNGAQSLMLDVDGNGAADALTDGILITRFLFGFRGNTLIDGAIDSSGSRNTAEAVEAFLAGFLPGATLAAEVATVSGDASTAESAAGPISPATTSGTEASSVVMSSSEEPARDLSLASMQQSWVQDFVAGNSMADEEDEDEDLLITLPG